jgi:hypothetical protein
MTGYSYNPVHLYACLYCTLKTVSLPVSSRSVVHVYSFPYASILVYLSSCLPTYLYACIIQSCMGQFSYIRTWIIYLYACLLVFRDTCISLCPYSWMPIPEGLYSCRPAPLHPLLGQWVMFCGGLQWDWLLYCPLYGLLNSSQAKSGPQLYKPGSRCNFFLIQGNLQ